MAELYLVASHGYPPGFFFPPADQALGKVYKDYQPLLSNPGLCHDSRQPCLYRRPLLHLKENPLKPSIGMLEKSDIFRHDSTTWRYVLNDGQDFHPSFLVFSSGIARQFTLHEKILRLIMSGDSEAERSGMDLSSLLDLMERHAPATHRSQEPLLPHYGQALLDIEPQPPLISLNVEFCPEKPILIGDSNHGSDITYDMCYPNDRVSLSSSGVEMDDVFSTLSDIYSSKSPIKWKKPEMVVPYFDRRTKKTARIDATGPSPKQSVKSSEKVNYKASSKKKSGVKGVKERDIYRNNSFHACESLLSVIVDKKQDGKSAIHSLKRSGPELPKVLTQFSASIAGTGLAVLFSVVCKVACSRVPFCASKLLNAGLGIGLVWLSWAVNKLRDTVIAISKNSEELDLREGEIVDKLDRSVKDIYFRAAAILAVAVLRFA